MYLLWNSSAPSNKGCHSQSYLLCVSSLHQGFALCGELAHPCTCPVFRHVRAAVSHALVLEHLSLFCPGDCRNKGQTVLCSQCGSIWAVGRAGISWELTVGYCVCPYAELLHSALRLTFSFSRGKSAPPKNSGCSNAFCSGFAGSQPACSLGNWGDLASCTLQLTHSRWIPDPQQPWKESRSFFLLRTHADVSPLSGPFIICSASLHSLLSPSVSSSHWNAVSLQSWMLGLNFPLVLGLTYKALEDLPKTVICISTTEAQKLTYPISRYLCIPAAACAWLFVKV